MGRGGKWWTSPPVLERESGHGWDEGRSGVAGEENRAERRWEASRPGGCAGPCSAH